jgi:hypothetical protein
LEAKAVADEGLPENCPPGRKLTGKMQREGYLLSLHTGHEDGLVRFEKLLQRLNRRQGLTRNALQQRVHGAMMNQQTPHMPDFDEPFSHLPMLAFDERV